MAGSERTKMAAGEWYTCLDAELEALRATAGDAVFEHNSLSPRQRGNLGPALKVLLGGAGEGARIEAPFHCAYGFNIFLATAPSSMPAAPSWTPRPCASARAPSSAPARW